LITRVEVLNYRMLRDVSQPLDRFRILVGPNASGKSTFLDVLRFIRDVLAPEKGPSGAVEERCRDIRELVWAGAGSAVQVAVDVALPADLLMECPAPTFRYELEVGAPLGSGPATINAEALFFYPDGGVIRPSPEQPSMFPQLRPPRSSALELDSRRRVPGRQKVVSKTRDSGRDYYQWKPPGLEGKQLWHQSFAVGRERTALFFIPRAEDDNEHYYEAPRWIRDFLVDRIVPVQLDVAAMREASSPLRQGPFRADGSNLPWAVLTLRQGYGRLFDDWLAHVRTILPEILDVQAIVRDEDRHCYLAVRYEPNLEVPAWLVSDGTLRVLALTLLAYYPFGPSLFLIEEPENGLHPRAVEGLYESLSSMWRHQVLLATHSPALLRLANPNQVLCFSNAGESTTDIVCGEQHPRLREWRDEVNLADLNAMGVLS